MKQSQIQSLILEAINLEDAGPFATSKDALNYAKDRFESEMGWQWREQNKSRFAAAKDWFQGLAINVPYMNYEIEELGLDVGNYWSDLALVFLGMLERGIKS